MLHPLPSKYRSHAARGRENQPLFSSTDSAEIPSGNFTIRLGPSRASSISTSQIWFSSAGRPPSCWSDRWDFSPDVSPPR
ncbi:hypothetical protein KSP39_PZI002396 [Platanthera zijinensis]|uniref:Uncharacterized protein n=1 Tax=Platanthera zijinensis TaxID=2320716 RepID=A0AAP0GE89_9ASPA